MGLVVESEGDGCPTEGYTKIDLCRRTVAEATGIQQTWQEVGSTGSRQRWLIAVYESASS